jgi:putative Mg2+ transporter-C (MgtC) family protein
MYYELYDLLLAVAIGAIIGAEREYHSKSAGLRTMIMVSLSSCLFTIISLKIGVENPDRLAANVLTGLGFLGAGVILKDDNRISGITTATTIWMTAALGMAVGAGYEKLSIWATLMVMVVLVLLMYVQRGIEHLNQEREYEIVCPFEKDELDRYEALFKHYQLKVMHSTQQKAGQRMTGHWVLMGSAENHQKLALHLLKDDTIQELSF